MRRLLLAALLAIATGCASTRVVSTWANPALASRRIESFAVFTSTGYPLISKTIQSFASTQVNPVVVGGAVSSGWDAAGFYEYWSAPLTFAEYTTEEDRFVGETVLWALPDDRAMWAMRTSTHRTDPGAFADDIAATVAADLRKAGIVPDR
ncbi:MAG TPA: hypothetical protein VMH40_15810 [Myxococcaceae bacterium]|nr:hypothetical protein [Myxococcaceae bacterium]